MSEHKPKNDNHGGKETKDLTDEQQEETAAELVPDFTVEESNRANEGFSPRMIAYTSLALGIVSLFVLPGILGIAGALLSIPAMIRGEKLIGGWAVSIAAFSLFLHYFFLPFI
ncbi:DUF4190 domain-containing protein [Siminovitchia sp. 179-K 8D1 HS]|uniref:DUF4190 domain-containing protein n=1 Tax=Siminovitchia sp. 179-K 8D1 HS TaxID=3142385 RepID=UPI0039A367F9